MHDRRLPDLGLLPTFEAAARHLSFTRAGDELALTQSAVSRQIQALEQNLGVQLFERRTRALLLTAAGRTLLRTVEEVLERIDRTTRELRTTPENRTVTLTTTPGFASLWLIPRLVRFTEAHPGVDVRTSATNHLVDIDRTGVDLAVRYCAEHDSHGGERLFGGQVTVVCSPRIVERGSARLESPADLRNFTMLYLDDPNAAWFDWSLWFHALGLVDFEPARRLHFSHYDQLINAAVNGQGLALGLDPLVRQLLRDGKLVAPFPRTAVAARAWYLVRGAARRDRPEIAAFVDWLRAEVAADADRTPALGAKAGTRRRRVPGR